MARTASLVICAAVGVLARVALGGVAAVATEPTEPRSGGEPPCDMTPTAQVTAVAAALKELRGKGYSAQQGHFRVVNSTSFGANPGNPYVMYEFAGTGKLPAFRLEPRSAVLFVGCTPAGARYFSWRSYLMTDPKLVFASLGDSLNNLVINTKGGGSGSVGGKTAAVVTTGDAATMADIRAALSTAGLGDATNIDGYDPKVIPRPTGLATTFGMLHRAAVWTNDEDKQPYFAQDRECY